MSSRDEKYINGTDRNHLVTAVKYNDKNSYFRNFSKINAIDKIPEISINLSSRATKVSPSLSSTCFHLWGFPAHQQDKLD